MMGHNWLPDGAFSVACTICSYTQGGDHCPVINGSLPFSRTGISGSMLVPRPRAVQVCPYPVHKETDRPQALGEGNRLHTALSRFTASLGPGAPRRVQEWPGLGWGLPLESGLLGPGALRSPVRELGRSGVSSVWGGQDREALVSWPRARTSRQAWGGCRPAGSLPRPTRVTDRLSHLLGWDGAR